MIWNATSERVDGAELYMGDFPCFPGGDLAPGGAAQDAMGFAVQRFSTARVIWTTKDGIKHEETIDLKQALPGPLRGVTVAFKICPDLTVEVIVVKPGETEPWGEHATCC